MANIGSDVYVHRCKNSRQTQFSVNTCQQSATNDGLYRIENYNLDLVIWKDLIWTSEPTFPSLSWPVTILNINVTKFCWSNTAAYTLHRMNTLCTRCRHPNHRRTRDMSWWKRQDRELHVNVRRDKSASEVTTLWRRNTKSLYYYYYKTRPKNGQQPSAKVSTVKPA